MTDYQDSADQDLDRGGDAARSSGKARWRDSLRMIAVTAEQLATAGGSGETTGYVPTVPASSEERWLD